MWWWVGGGTELVSQLEYEQRRRRYTGQVTEIKFILYKPLS